MTNRLFRYLTSAAALGLCTAQAQLSITKLTGFGGTDGWLAPGEGGYAFLGTANNERGLAFGNDHLYLVSRSGGNSIRILNSLTGAEVGTLNTSGISGGTFAVNQAGVGSDGAIYVGNLTTAATATGSGAFKVYRWANELAAPTVAYSGAPLAGARIGDSFTAFGSGSATRLAAGFGNSPVVAGNNGFALIDPTANTATAVGFAGTPPAAGDFRLGITFGDASHVWGTQGGVLRYASFSGSSGTLLNSYTPASNQERLMAQTTLFGIPLVAVQSTGDSHVSIYNVSDPSAPVLLGSGNNTTGTLTGNGNGAGQVAWGKITYDSNTGLISETLYAMSANQGIQAFVVTIPEPGSLALAGLGLAAVLIARRR